MERQLATVQVIGDIEPIPDADKIGFIYKITNIITGKIYIGKSTYSNLDRLKIRYKKEIKYQKSSSRYIINSMRVHGFENFKFEIVRDSVSEIELNKLEMYYIELYKTMDVTIGYNLTIGGDCTMGFKWPEERKKKFSEARCDGRYKGKKNPFYGKTHSQTTKDKIIASNKRRLGGTHKGIPHREETKLRISNSLKGENNPRYIKIDQSTFTELVVNGVSYFDICKTFGISIPCFYEERGQGVEKTHGFNRGMNRTPCITTENYKSNS